MRTRPTFVADSARIKANLHAAQFIMAAAVHFPQPAALIASVGSVIDYSFKYNRVGGPHQLSSIRINRLFPPLFFLRFQESPRILDGRRRRRRRRRCEQGGGRWAGTAVVHLFEFDKKRTCVPAAENQKFHLDAIALFHLILFPHVFFSLYNINSILLLFLLLLLYSGWYYSLLYSLLSYWMDLWIFDVESWMWLRFAARWRARRRI